MAHHALVDGAREESSRAKALAATAPSCRELARCGERRGAHRLQGHGTSSAAATSTALRMPSS